jgi:hypothetical protein
MSDLDKIIDAVKKTSYKPLIDRNVLMVKLIAVLGLSNKRVASITAFEAYNLCILEGHPELAREIKVYGASIKIPWKNLLFTSSTHRGVGIARSAIYHIIHTAIKTLKMRGVSVNRGGINILHAIYRILQSMKPGSIWEKWKGKSWLMKVVMDLGKLPSIGSSYDDPMEWGPYSKSVFASIK